MIRRQMTSRCSTGFEPVIIATKVDKLKRSQVQKQIKAVRDGLGMRQEEKLFPFSAVTRQGRDEILDYIGELTGALES